MEANCIRFFGEEICHENMLNSWYIKMFLIKIEVVGSMNGYK